MSGETERGRKSLGLPAFGAFEQGLRQPWYPRDTRSFRLQVVVHTPRQSSAASPCPLTAARTSCAHRSDSPLKHVWTI